ncbi:hypothetical protein ALC57_11581, partial [Trachymyrmex cornetzi]
GRSFKHPPPLYSNVLMANFTRDDWENFTSASHCHVCEKLFMKDDMRVRDHCHLTRRYRGPAHSNCNLNYKDSHCIPVVFHNSSGYDVHFMGGSCPTGCYPHFIIKEIATTYEGHVDLLPITKEKYISFTKHVDSTKIDQKNCVQLRFIDSYRFLASSLDKLSSFLNNDKLWVLRREFSNSSEENFNLLTRKGVFPYEYIDCSEKLNELCLPPRKSFYSSLTDSTVSESYYARAVNVWLRFSVQTLGEYSDLYLKTDVFLLADVFENFRANCIASYGFDPAYWMSLLTTLSVEHAHEVYLKCLEFYKTIIREMLKRLPYNDEIFKQLRNIDITKLANEWRILPSFFNDVISQDKDKIDNRSMSPDFMWKKIFESVNLNNNKIFPNLELVCAVLSFPHSNAEAERIFSIVPDVKNKKRNRILNETIFAICVMRSSFQAKGNNCINFEVLPDHLKLHNSQNLYGDGASDDF